jgi:hypothetical protein
MRSRRAITDPQDTMTFFIHRAFLSSRLNAPTNDHNIVKTVQVPVVFLEDVIEKHRATVLISDIEGGEVDLLPYADLSGIRLVILETHYGEAGVAATDEMVRQLIISGYSLDLELSHTRYLVLRRRSK